MDKRKAYAKAAILGLALATAYGPAQATIIYNTPGTTNVNAPVLDNAIVDSSATTVNVGTGGLIRGVNDPSLGGFNAAVRTRRGTLNVTGNGRILAGIGQQQAINMTGNPSVVRLSNNALVVGDVVNDFTPSGWQSEGSAVRLYLEDSARIHGDVRYAGYMRIEDNARVNGNIVNPDNGSYSLEMFGGVVTGLVAMGGLNDYVFNMHGGSILGGVRGAAGFMDMTMTGGTINNGFRTGDVVTGGIFGGTINGGIDLTSNTTGASHLTIDGGHFNATAGDYLFSMSDSNGFGGNSSLDIFGGEFGYVESGLGFFLDYLVDFSIYGWDLSYTGGILSGYLLDGSWFSNALTFGSSWAGSFNIFNTTSLLTMNEPSALLASLDPLASLETQSVPEPGTLGLLAACAAGMMLFGRRKVIA